MFNKPFKWLLLALLFTELFSFCAWLWPTFNSIIFFIILALTLILSLRKLEYGLYFVLAELFVGSQGYLFYLETPAGKISIRIGLFIILMAVWLAKLFLNLKEKNWRWRDLEYFSLRKSKLFKYYLALFIILLWGLLWAIIRKNSFDNIFFDFNGYLYFGLIFVFFDAIKEQKQIQNIFSIFLACLIIICFKTLLAVYVFSHNFPDLIYPLYQWVRTSGVGEITETSTGLMRIFFQSQIYALIGFFILLLQLSLRGGATATTKQSPGIRNVLSYSRGLLRRSRWSLLAMTLSVAVLLASFSRSFWLAILVTLLFLYFLKIFILKTGVWPVLKLTLIFLLVSGLGLGLLLTLANFPYPQVRHLALGSMFADRALTLTGEAGVASRYLLLKPLIKEVAKHPVIGSGFGSTVTFKTQDPRFLAEHPDGIRTTYAFEWGYLDIWLKIGLAGLIIYLVLIYKIWQKGWQQIKKAGNPGLLLGLFLGLIALLITNSVSPYLNHPLGIGYLMLLSVVFWENIFK